MGHGSVLNHRDLDVWKLAVEVTLRLYQCTHQFPVQERFGLTSQMRRSAVSIVSNIAEGAARGSSSEFARFLHCARGSVAELDAQMVIAARLGYVSDERSIPNDLYRLNVMLTRLIRKLAMKRRSPVD